MPASQRTTRTRKPAGDQTRWERADRAAVGAFHSISTSDYTLYHCDAFDWLAAAPPCSIEAVVTDPPYGLVEYTEEQLRKRSIGRGGVWRIPPTLDGCQRSPLPRFTVLGPEDHQRLREFFDRLATGLLRVMVPGAHLLIATNPLVSHLVYEPLIAAGFEKRGEVIRLVQTLRGGDRPKNAEGEFPMVTVMPRSGWEPWGLFRKPCEGRVQDNLRQWKTGGLRRISQDEPFRDVIASSVASRREREIADHPALKPQRFLRAVCRAALPLGQGTILDPFMGSGSTVAAAASQGQRSIGIESRADYFHLAVNAIPQLAAIVFPSTPAAAPPRRQRGNRTNNPLTHAAPMRHVAGTDLR